MKIGFDLVKWFLRKLSFKFNMLMAFGQGQKMTLTLNTHFMNLKSKSSPLIITLVNLYIALPGSTRTCRGLIR